MNDELGHVVVRDWGVGCACSHFGECPDLLFAWKRTFVGKN